MKIAMGQSFKTRSYIHIAAEALKTACLLRTQCDSYQKNWITELFASFKFLTCFNIKGFDHVKFALG